MTTSQISIATTTSTLDSRKSTAVPLSEINNDQGSHSGSFVSYNPALASLPNEPTILEVPAAEESTNMYDMDTNEAERETSMDLVEVRKHEIQDVDDNENLKV